MIKGGWRKIGHVVKMALARVKKKKKNLKSKEATQKEELLKFAYVHFTHSLYFYTISASVTHVTEKPLCCTFSKKEPTPPI